MDGMVKALTKWVFDWAKKLIDPIRNDHEYIVPCQPNLPINRIP